MKNQTKQRKKEHLDIFRNENIRFDKKNGFEKYRLVHTALPEIDFDSIDLTTQFLGYPLSFPFMINPITGGEKNGKELNRILATVASKHKIAFSTGSIRPCLEDENALNSFSIAKEIAPNIPVIGNLGGQQLLEYSYTKIADLIERLQFDALTIHLNPLQEVLQPEGDREFHGIYDKILEINENAKVPILVKEVGFGLSVDDITKLAQGGISWVDIAGAGGTSWAKVEQFRGRTTRERQVAGEFANFGQSTAAALLDALSVRNINIIASGGLDNGLDVAKALAMGAHLVASAGAILDAYYVGGNEGLSELILRYKQTLKIAFFITGSKNLEDFQKLNNIIHD